MKALADTIYLRTIRLGLRVIHKLDRQIELVGVVLDLAAILRAPVRQDTRRNMLTHSPESPAPVRE